MNSQTDLEASPDSLSKPFNFPAEQNTSFIDISTSELEHSDLVDEFGEFANGTQEEFFYNKPEDNLSDGLEPEVSFFPKNLESTPKPWNDPQFFLGDEKPSTPTIPDRFRLYGGPRCLDLWQSLAFNEELSDIRFNNRSKLRWKQSLMRRHSLLALGVPFDLDEVSHSITNSFNFSSDCYAPKDIAIAAKRLDTTMAHSFCNVKSETLSSYSIADLQQLEFQMLQVLEEVSLSIEHWRTEVRSVEENQEMYQQMIANLVRHTHKSKLSMSRTNSSRSDSVPKK